MVPTHYRLNSFINLRWPRNDCARLLTQANRSFFPEIFFTGSVMLRLRIQWWIRHRSVVRRLRVVVGASKAGGWSSPVVGDATTPLIHVQIAIAGAGAHRYFLYLSPFAPQTAPLN